MKINEVLKEENIGKRYRTNIVDDVFVVTKKYDNFLNLRTENDEVLIESIIYLTQIINCDFEEIKEDKNFSTLETKVSYHIGKSGDIYTSTVGQYRVENYNEFTNREYAELVHYKQWFERSLLAYKDKHHDVCDTNKEDGVKYYVKMNYVTGKMVIDWTSKITIQGTIQFNSKGLLERHLIEHTRGWVKYFDVCEKLM